MKTSEYQEWLQENPLYEFRKENNLSRSALAGYLRLSVSTIQFWENAGNIPNDENMQKLADLLELDKGDLKTKWHNWLNDQPSIINTK